MLHESESRNLRNLLAPLNLPQHRKDKHSTGNLQWLSRNIGICNSKHANCNPAMTLIAKALAPHKGDT